MSTNWGGCTKWVATCVLVFALTIHVAAEAQDKSNYDCDYMGQMSQTEWSQQGNELLKTGVKQSDKGTILAAIWGGADPSKLAGTRWYEIGEHERLNVLLMAAVATDNLNQVRHLLARGADPNAEGRLDDILTPLITASECASPAMVLLLIHSGSRVNDHGFYPGGNNEIIDNTSALIWASYRGDPKIVAILLKEGADPNDQETYSYLDDKTHKSERGMTPLLTDPPPSVMKELLAAGARPNVADSNDETPLMMAAISGSYEDCDLLLKFGADRRLRDKSGDTASDFATMSKKQALGRWIDAWHIGASLPIGGAK